MRGFCLRVKRWLVRRSKTQSSRVHGVAAPSRRWKKRTLALTLWAQKMPVGRVWTSVVVEQVTADRLAGPALEQDVVGDHARRAAPYPEEADHVLERS